MTPEARNHQINQKYRLAIRDYDRATGRDDRHGMTRGERERLMALKKTGFDVMSAAMLIVRERSNDDWNTGSGDPTARPGHS